jgi:hypothetical protein
MWPFAVLKRTVAAVWNEFVSPTGGFEFTPTPVSSSVPPTARGVASTITVNVPDCAGKPWL